MISMIHPDRLVAMLALVVCAAFSYGATRPNIVLIMADDLGYETLGSYGSASFDTPHLDRMAEQGIRFTRAHAQPKCTPTRLKIMTGRYNFRNYTEFGALSPDEITFGHMLQKAGYETLVAGKWQLYGRSGRGTHPDDAGFDDYLLWQVTRGRADGERYADPLLLRKGEKVRQYTGTYGPDMFTDFILDFIKRKRDAPFFVYFPMSLVHSPHMPTPDSNDWSIDRHAIDDKYFPDMVAYMDKMVGRILNELDVLGLRENTIVLFTGDNGTVPTLTRKLRSGRVILGGKGATTDPGTHVPLIALWPGTVASGVVSDDLIDFTDFFVTFAELADAALPDDRILDGVSFAPQLRGEPGSPRKWLFSSWQSSGRYVHNGRSRLYDNGRFFDLRADPDEESPLELKSLDTELAVEYGKLQHALDSVGGCKGRN